MRHDTICSLPTKITISSQILLPFIYTRNHRHSFLSTSKLTNSSLLLSHSQSQSYPFSIIPSSLHKSSPNSCKTMATCVDTCRTNRTQTCDSDRNYSNYYRPSYCNQIPPKPICQKSQLDEDDLWINMVEEAKNDVEQEPILSNYYYNSILSHNCLESALANHLASKLSSSSLNSNTLFDLFYGVLIDDREIIKSVKEDLKAVRERDPACVSYIHCFLNFKGFLACQSHRIAHKVWTQGRKILAFLIQNRVSEVFAVDIHPGAKIGRGILFDHATGVVIGETAVIGNNVSILHHVTLGGTGKTCGDRHPKIGDGVLIGAGTCILGNVKIGDGAKIGAGSVVLKEVPPKTTAVGNPARLIGGKENPIKLDKIPSFTMDHTSHINEWSDYVI